MNRRQILTRIVQGFSLTSVGLVIYPFIKAWQPSTTKSVSLEVNLVDLEPGQSMLVRWLGRNILVQRRSEQTIQKIAIDHQKSPQEALKDRYSMASTQPGFARNNTRSLTPDIFVSYVNCTHLGCEVLPTEGDFKCPCHNSNFDYAGRVLEGAAAPTNLEIPSYQFVSENVLLLEQIEG
ncbi:MAG: ubiquinol-cytochrome c reductase iron-sulfur subunit [Pseudomonadales bacterium]|nr:ubiquinol-cytochrome c reductase iron-sulfur subunit [Pseudomonadales bacterium]